MKTVWVVLGALLPLMVGCGEPKCGDEQASPPTRCAAPEPTACEDLGDAYARVEQHAAACVQEGEQPARQFSPSLCEANIHQCSEEERRRLAMFSDCFRAVPACTLETEEQFNTSLFLCALDAAGGLSEACLRILPDPQASALSAGASGGLQRLLQGR